MSNHRRHQYHHLEPFTPQSLLLSFFLLLLMVPADKKRWRQVGVTSSSAEFPKRKKERRSGELYAAAADAANWHLRVNLATAAAAVVAIVFAEGQRQQKR